MIQGIGTDIVEVKRIEDKIKKNKDFQFHVFSKDEIEYCEKQKNPFIHFAARWAAKEAYLKAFSLNFIGNHRLHEIEVLHKTNGNPYIKLSGDALQNHLNKNLGNIHISLSHTELYAVAYLIIEQ